MDLKSNKPKKNGPHGLETTYKTPKVILTVMANPIHLQIVKAIKALGILLIAYYLINFEFRESLLLSLSTAILMIALVMAILSRPKVVLHGIKKKMHVFGSRDLSGKSEILPHRIQSVLVKSKRVKPHTEIWGKKGKRKDAGEWYFTRLVLKKSPKSWKTETVDCFELEDMNQAQYLAMLLAAFARTNAFDYKGKLLPSLESHIPTRFLAG